MEKNDLFKCSVCGNIVELLHVGGGTLVCCGKEMQKLEANKEEASTDKHIPVLSNTDSGFVVKVGETPHPMEESHFIEFIEVFFDDGKVGRKYLSPNDEPMAEFHQQKMPSRVRAYCNIHGLWEN